MLPENCSHPLRATRLYASLRRLLTVSAASGPPTRAFFISGRAARSICLPSVGIAENLPPLPGSCALFARGTLWTDPQTASRDPKGAPISRRIDSTCYAVFRLRSEEHTSELQSHLNLVCRLLL